MKPKNKRYDKANEIYRKLEALLLECQEFEGTVEYFDIIASLSRALKSINEVKINAIKQGNVK